MQYMQEEYETPWKTRYIHSQIIIWITFLCAAQESVYHMNFAVLGVLNQALPH